MPKHGEPAYPLASYGDGWGEATPEMYEKSSTVIGNRGTYTVTQN